MKFPSLWRIALLLLIQAKMTPALAATTSGTGYTVKSGDTFAKIARSRGISLSTLLKANRIGNPDRIKLGQRLVIPGAAAEKTVAKKETKSSAKVTAKTPAKTATAKSPEKKSRTDSTTVNIAPPPPAAGGYTVQTGDTLSRISKRTGVSPARLMALNGLTEDSTLRIGQTLRTGGTATAKKTPAIEQPAVADNSAKPLYIKDPAAPPSAPAAVTTISHKVKSGETFTSLTRTYGVTSAQLTAANRGLDPRRLRPGQNVLIPGQPAREQARPLTVRADGRILAEHRDPLDPSFAAEPAPVTERTRTGYQVESGDTLNDIARRYNTTADYLRGLNRMGPSEDVYQGRYILVPFTPRNPAAPASRRQDA